MKKKGNELPNVSFDEEEETPTGGLFNAQSAAALQQPETQRTIVQIPVHLIDPSPYQKRKNFQEQSINDFADVMRKKGFTSVIWVRPKPNAYGRYELIYGERRWRAARIVARDPEPKFTTISCEIKTDINDPLELLELGLIENIQRVDLVASEEAASFQEMLSLKREDGSRAYTIETLADTVKKSISYVQDRLYLLELPEDVRAAYDRNNKIALRALREVTRIPSPEARTPILDLLVQGEYSVRAVRDVIAEMEQQQELEQRVSTDVTEHSIQPFSASEVFIGSLEAEPTRFDSTEADSAHEENVVHVAEHTRRSGSQPVTLEHPVLSNVKHKSEKELGTYKSVISRDKKSVSQVFERWGKLSSEQGDDVRLLVQEAVDELNQLCLRLQLPTVG